MDILFVNCNYRLFDNLDSGAANRSTMLVRALSNLGHVDVVSFHKDKLQSNISNCDVIYNNYVPYVNNPDFLHKIIRKTGPFLCSKNPYLYYDISKQREDVICKIVNKNKYDIIVCRYIIDAITCGLLKYSEKLVIDIDDNPVNATIRDISNCNYKYTFSKRIDLLRAIQMKSMVNKILDNVFCSFYSNILEPIHPDSVYLHNVPSIVNVLPSVNANQPMRLLIVGWLDFIPNRNGVLHFVKYVFPSIKSRVPNVELHIAGKTKDSNLLKELNSIEGICALGFVDDLISEYKDCRVVVVPVYDGSGTSVKFVEGMMMNRPIVTTPMGVRGFEHFFKPGIHYQLANDDNEFSDKIIYLLTNHSVSQVQAQKALGIASEELSQKKFFDIVSATILK